MTKHTLREKPATATAIDPLREKLAARELERARAVLVERGAVGLLAHAEALLALAARDASAAAEGSAERAYEAHVRRRNRLELECEVSLAVLSRLDTTLLLTVDLGRLVALAEPHGRWSRRVEALRLLRVLASSGAAGGRAEHLAPAVEALASASEHRWVQVAAVEALAAIDERRAQAVVEARLEAPGGADDFLVRERLVDVAARRTWSDLVTRASRDPSEHVRITAARHERRIEVLANSARNDTSFRVRAAAVSTLGPIAGAAAISLLLRAIEHDPHPLPTRMAALTLLQLARSGDFAVDASVAARVDAARHREGLSPVARARLSTIAFELAVLGSPRERRALERLRPLARHAPNGGGLRIRSEELSSLSDEALGRVLAVLSDRDFALSVDRRDGELVLFRGEPRVPKLWRLLHELTHLSPSKRQGYAHTIGRAPRGALRAPPSGLAELTATTVPGERVYLGAVGDWGREVPLVDDLLSLGLFRPSPIVVVTPQATTTITPPGRFFARLLARVVLTLHYARFAEQRRRSIESPEADIRNRFAVDVARATGITITTVPRTTGGVPTAPRALAHAPPRVEAEHHAASTGPHAASPPLFGLAIPTSLEAGARTGLGESAGSLQTTLTDWLALARERLTAPGENHLVHVALFAALALVALLARGAYVRKRIDTMRKSIPLVIGGWGTRGKSGTERLKAGVFQGLGYECLVKTTGCEAMVIHAIPGTRAREVFLYRPYDKATVWEQRDVLALAHRLEVDVFLWECMALQPDLVDLLQSQWMRDDYSTITNAYPDHEDVQGPTGYDVASVIAEFVPTGGHLFTAEDQMLPLLRDRADERGTTLRAVEEHEAEMISDELLDRFPYREHPHNIALVAALARALGVNEAVAITEMADHVVPDLGVLKTYPPLAHEGRTLVFTNGMSANERTGALSNWRRMGFDGHAPDDDPRRFIVTVVNNRADRLARSEVFARFLVDDIGAERHVLIGTNVSGLLGFLRDALAKRLERVDPTRELPPGEARLETARARLARAWAPLKVPACDAASVARELEAFGLEPLATDTIEALLMPSALEESYAEACAAIRVQLGDAFAPEARPFVVRSLARRRVTFAVRSALETWIDVDARRFARVFRAAYRELFEESLVVLDNPALTGDQVISAVAEAVPPGARVDVMGLQNIKGTGLDFVYRFVSLELVSSAVRRLASASPDVRRAALLELSAHGDYGLFDARVANDAVLAAKESDPMASALPYDDTLAHLARAIDARRSAFRSTRTTGVSRAMRLAVGRALDHLDAVRRRAMARAVVRDLASGRVRHAEAAARMRDLVARQKGAWALERP